VLSNFVLIKSIQLKNQYLEEAKRELINGHAKKGHPFRYFVLLQMKMANQGSARLCCENITGLKFGDLYRQKNSKRYSK
jgi:hypothetical protein